MRKVTLNFIGDRSELVAEKFYSWLIDGGLEETIAEGLSDEIVDVDGIIDFDNENLEVAFASYLVNEEDEYEDIDIEDE